MPCFDRDFLPALLFTHSKMLNAFTYNPNGMNTCQIDIKIKNINQEILMHYQGYYYTLLKEDMANKGSVGALSL